MLDGLGGENRQLQKPILDPSFQTFKIMKFKKKKLN